MKKSTWIWRGLASFGIFLSGSTVQADTAAEGAASEAFAPPSLLAGNWQSAGTYDLNVAGIRIEVKPSQHILLFGDKPPAPYRGCRANIQALVHDPKLGLMLIGRETAGRPVVEDWDDPVVKVFSDMPKFYQERTTHGSPRYPISYADFYVQPRYDATVHGARWIYSFVSNDKPWFASNWYTFDRDGYTVVTLISQGPGLDGLDAVLQASSAAPIAVENLRPHESPLVASAKNEAYTTAMLASMAEPMIGACVFRTPFGDSF
jgi:hypothetical protein